MGRVGSSSVPGPTHESVSSIIRCASTSHGTIGDRRAICQGTFVLAPFPYATGSLFLLIGTIVLVAFADLVLGGVIFVGLLLILVIDVHGAFKTFGPFVEVQQVRGEVSEIAHESVDGALTVKALGRRREETERFEEASDRLRDKIGVCRSGRFQDLVQRGIGPSELDIFRDGAAE